MNMNISTGASDDNDAVGKLIDKLGPSGNEIGMSLVLGFASGYALKKVGRFTAIVVGLGFIAVQVMLALYL